MAKIYKPKDKSWNGLYKKFIHVARTATNGGLIYPQRLEKTTALLKWKESNRDKKAIFKKKNNKMERFPDYWFFQEEKLQINNITNEKVT